MSVLSPALRNIVADAYARAFARPWLSSFNKALVYLGSRGLGVYNLSSSRLSGEDFFLQTLSDTPPATIFDVGANEGDYTAAAHARFPKSAIYAFEPHPRTFERLKRRNDSIAQCFNLGCDTTKGHFNLYDLAGEKGTQLASMSKEALVPLGREIESFSVETTSLDEFCRERSIERIDLLKIDTEGNERRVLEGARRLISEDAVKSIQFEFNEMNVASRSFLKDFISLLPRHRLFRLLPDGLLPLDRYSPFFSEVFGYQNIVALSS